MSPLLEGLLAAQAPSPGRLVTLLVVVAATALLFLAFRSYRSRLPSSPARVDPDALGLDPAETGRAFVVFTTASCPPCRAALRVLESATEGAERTDVVIIDAVERADLATRYEVRAIPTTFLIDGERLVDRWVGVPEPEDVRASLAAV